MQNPQNPSSLEALLQEIQAGHYSDREMTRLPTFGGDAPRDTHGVFSWDAGRLLIQDQNGWRIIPRER